jgi:hypothetical protein
MKRRTLNELYNEYKIRHGGSPKHSFAHFIRVMNMLTHHKTLIRPRIQWWEESQKEGN